MKNDFFIVCLVIIFLLLTPIPASVFKSKAKLNKSNPLSTRSDQWILDLQANINNPYWFYKHLNESNRRNIRIALDYLIPRKQIIDTLLVGNGYLLATTVVPQSGQLYDTSLSPRVIDNTTAKALLNHVFGYVYNASTDNPVTPYNESVPYFKMTMTMATTCPLRGQWGPMINYAFSAFGIDVSYKSWTWNTIIDRLFYHSGYKNNYENGGFDGQFLGWGASTLPDDSFFFNSKYLPPNNGSNYQGVNDSYLDSLFAIIDSSNSLSQVYETYHKYQQYFYDNALRYILFQEKVFYGLNSHVKGFNPILGSNIQYQNISFSNNQTSLTIAKRGEFDLNSFTPYSDYISEYIFSTSNYGLFTLSTPPGDMRPNNIQPYNFFAEWYNQSSDGLTWFFNLKSGLMWEDGSPLNTSDIEFSYNSILNQSNNLYKYGYFAKFLNSSEEAGITVHNSTLIEFRLQKPAPFSFYSLWNLPIISKKANKTNYLSNGPYRIEFLTNNLTKLVNTSIWTPSYYNKFTDVPFMNTALENGGWPVITNVTIVDANSQYDQLVSLLKEGDFDVIDSNLVYYSMLDQFTGNSTVVPTLGNSFQEFGLNQGSPIWGISPVEPLIKAKSNSSSIDTSSLLSTGSSTSLINYGSSTSHPNTTFGLKSTLAIIILASISLIRRKTRFRFKEKNKK